MKSISFNIPEGYYWLGKIYQHGFGKVELLDYCLSNPMK